MNYIHPYFPCFQYFSYQLKEKDWSTYRVLDFGGNGGNLLRDPSSTIRHDYYTCLDVDSAPIIKGQKDFPEATWLSYNRFNSVYNHSGEILAPLPEFSVPFDVIVAFSVFTHTSRQEMLHTIRDELLPLLKSGGRLAFTFLHPQMLVPFANKRFHNNPRINRENILKKAQGLSQFFYINDDIIQTEDPQLDLKTKALLSFYTEDEMRKIFSDSELQIMPPAFHEIQHCAIIRAQ